MIHINNFVDQIKFFEARQAKDFIMTLNEAKGLHADITKLLLVVHDKHNSLHQLSKNNDLDGGNWQ